MKLGIALVVLGSILAVWFVVMLFIEDLALAGIIRACVVIPPLFLIGVSKIRSARRQKDG